MFEMVCIEGDEIVLRVTKDTLVKGTKYVLATYIEELGRFREVKVVDPDAWMKEVVLALNAERTDGDTPVHHLLDEAVYHAFEQGAEGIFVEGVHDNPKPEKKGM